MNSTAGFLLGAGLAGSLLLLGAAIMGWQLPQRPRRVTGSASGVISGPNLARRFAIATSLAVVVGLFTRWPVLAGATLALAWLWPSIFGASAEEASKTRALEAVATWTESLRDTIAGSIALEEAIRTTAATAPAAIHDPLQRMVGALSVHVPLPQALADFADDFEDESIDLVAAALILNARLRGPGLVATLSALAKSTREELDMRRRLAQESAKLKRDARTIVISVLGFTGFIIFFSRPYLSPYSSVQGQFVLAIVIGIFVTGLVWMRRLARIRTHGRFLIGSEALAQRAAAERVSAS